MSSTSVPPSPTSSASVQASAIAASQAAQTGRVKKDGSQTAPQTPPPAPADSGAEQNPMFSSVPDVEPSPMDQAALIGLLQKLSVHSFENQLQGEESVTKAHQQKMHDYHKQNISKLNKIIHKHHKKKTGLLIGKIFGWVAAGLGIIVSVILIAVTLGTGSPIAAAMISLSLALAVTMIALEATDGMDKMSNALAGQIADILVDCGVDPQKAKMISKIIAQVAIALAVMAIQISLTVLSGGANAEEMSSEMVKMAVKIATVAAKTAVLASAVAQAGGAAADTASAVYSYQALNLQADMVDNQAVIKKLRTLMESEQEMIKEIVNSLMGTQDRMGEMMRDENESRAKVADFAARPAV